MTGTAPARGGWHIPDAAGFSLCRGVTAVPSLCQGREGPRRGSAFPSQEDVPSPGESCQPPRRTPGSGDISLDLLAGSTEASERSEWGWAWGRGQAWGLWADGVCVCRAGVDPASGGDIWKRIYQPSYIQEQYVLTHCSVSTDRSRGLLSHSSTSSESTGSRDVAPEAPGTDATSQQGQKSLSLCESTKSAPLPSAPAGTKVRMTMGFNGSCMGGLLPAYPGSHCPAMAGHVAARLETGALQPGF